MSDVPFHCLPLSPTFIRTDVSLVYLDPRRPCRVRLSPRTSTPGHRNPVRGGGRPERDCVTSRREVGTLTREGSAGGCERRGDEKDVL